MMNNVIKAIPNVADMPLMADKKKQHTTRSPGRTNSETAFFTRTPTNDGIIGIQFLDFFLKERSDLDLIEDTESIFAADYDDTKDQGEDMRRRVNDKESTQIHTSTTEDADADFDMFSETADDKIFRPAINTVLLLL